MTGLPRLMRADDGSFLADDTQMAPYEVGGGWMLLGEASVGERSFVGNSGIVGPGRQRAGPLARRRSLERPRTRGRRIVVAGASGDEMPRVAETGDVARTFDPPRRLVAARAFVESMRVIPWLVMAVLGVGVLTAFECIRTVVGLGRGRGCGRSGDVRRGLGRRTGDDAGQVAARGPVQGRASTRSGARSCGATSCSTSSTRSWVCRGSAARSSGRPIFNAWVRTLGAKIGKGVWLESLLAARDRPGAPRRRRHRQPRLRAADAPVPRPPLADQLGPPRARCDARPAQLRAPRRVDRRGGEDRPGFAGDARRVRAGRNAVGGKPDHRRGSGPGLGHRRQQGPPTKQGGAPTS